MPRVRFLPPALSAAPNTMVLMRECKGCARILTKRSQKDFCTLKCMQFERIRLLTEQWLATGRAVPGTHDGHYVREYIYADQRGRCAICGLSRQWRGRLLNFVLDHLDGDS